MRSAAAEIGALMRVFSRHQRVPWHGSSCACPCGAVGAHTHRGDTDYAFEMAASSIRYGAGVTAEVGHDVKALGAKNVLVLTDKNIAAIPHGPLVRTVAALKAAGVAHTVYDEVRIEPTDKSFSAAISRAKALRPDAFIAVGGGSVMDTAKAANLYYSHPDADFLDFVNAPVGRGKPVPGPVKPLIAVPTTAGTGSETTGVAIFDYTPMHAKTGIGSRLIKPTLGIVDPLNTSSAPATVAVASGFDVLCHALESYTAIPYNERSPRPATPALRPSYQGANPISDVWSTYALRLLAKYFIPSIKDRSNAEANAAMTLAATYAGVGFGNAGCHLAHGMSYGISGLNKGYFHPGYSKEHPLVPHGISVVLSAPAIFRMTAATNAARHLEAARILRGENPPVTLSMYSGAGETVRADDATTAEDAGKALSEQLLRFMDALNVPNGLRAIGYSEADIGNLVEVTLPQKRVLNLAPLSASSDVLSTLFKESMSVY